MSYTFHVESRPSGKIIVDVYSDSDYPDAADDLMRRVRELHRDALADWSAQWDRADECIPE